MSGALPRHYPSERAVAADESVSWAVVDEDLELPRRANATRSDCTLANLR
jgi:hypothetical protein